MLITIMMIAYKGEMEQNWELGTEQHEVGAFGTISEIRKWSLGIEFGRGSLDLCTVSTLTFVALLALRPRLLFTT